MWAENVLGRRRTFLYVVTRVRPGLESGGGNSVNFRIRNDQFELCIVKKSLQRSLKKGCCYDCIVFLPHDRCCNPIFAEIKNINPVYNTLNTSNSIIEH